MILRFGLLTTTDFGDFRGEDETATDDFGLIGVVGLVVATATAVDAGSGLAGETNNFDAAFTLPTEEAAPLPVLFGV